MFPLKTLNRPTASSQQQWRDRRVKDDREDDDRRVSVDLLIWGQFTVCLLWSRLVILSVTVVTGFQIQREQF